MTEEELQALLDSMSVEDKLLQITQMPYAYMKKEGGEITGPIKEFGLTEKEISRLGTILNVRSESGMRDIQENYQLKNGSKVPIAIMADVTHGFKTAFPIWIGLACSFDEELMKDCAEMQAKEAAVTGISMTCSAMVDLVRDARWGRVIESFGEDPFLGETTARANICGTQGNLDRYHVAGCVKHFVGYGACEAGRDYNTVDMSEYTLRNVYLPPFKAGIDAGAKLLMPAFNIMFGQPMVMNRKLMVDILRNEWGFDGVTISDYNACTEAITHGYCADEKEVALRAFQAKLDIEMSTMTYVKYLKELLEEGKISVEELDASVMRQLRLKNELGLFENSEYSYSKEEQEKIYLCEAHRALALRAAEESAVLLKNDGLLPLNANDSIALIGPHAREGDLIGGWRAECLPEDTVTVFDGVKSVCKGRVEYAKGCDWALDATDDGGFKKAIEIAKRADKVILMLGEAPQDSGEGCSKSNIDLPEIQYRLLDEILKVNGKVAVLLFTGRPLTIKRLHDRVPAILNIWWPGTEGGNAAANLLFGKKSPCGKLSMTFPVSVAQCPIYYNRFNTGRPRQDDTKRVSYCSSYIDGPNKPLYPFGFGLSYAKFEYSDVDLSRKRFSSGESITASVRVKNVGGCEAKEVVQLYIRDEFGSIVRPVKELKGFQKVGLKAGEERVVSFEINEKLLSFYRADMTFGAERGGFVAFIGGDSTVENGVRFELI